MLLPDWLTTVHHDGSPRYLQSGGRVGDAVTIRLRAAADAPLERVFLRICPDGEQKLHEMTAEAGDGPRRWWQISVPISMLRTGYRFLLRSPTTMYWYGAAGVTRHYPTDANDFRLLADYAAPAWVLDSVFYQIFPDRFADGDPTNNVQDGNYLYEGQPVIAKTWQQLPERGQGPREFFGGDLQGIAQKLDYLQDLGITALYLNPIFSAPSVHKYDVSDYRNVDAQLGGNAALAALREALDGAGMRLMLDIVPNHCGNLHPWFQAAQADETAPSADFFTFHQRPDDYEAWLDVKTLPKLNYKSEALRREMYADDESVMRMWLRPPYRIDGWRVDVANMLGKQGPADLGHKIGRGVRRAVKAERSDAYLLGEHMFDGSPHLQGGELDAGMNYQGFTFPVWRWLAADGLHTSFPESDAQAMPTEALTAQWQAFRAAIPWQITLQQFNLLGSHDTPRLRRILGNDLRRVRAAFALLFSYPGVPCLYYGDEIGLDGGADPDCRRPMPWDEQQWDHELRGYVQQLIRLRRNEPALRHGGFQLLYGAGDTVAFLRESSEQTLLVVVRRAEDGLRELPLARAAIADGTRLTELLSGRSATVRNGSLDLDSLPAVGAQIWQISAAARRGHV
jgi:alpha-glucosidase